jgi:hypothetical protein
MPKIPIITARAPQAPIQVGRVGSIEAQGMAAVGDGLKQAGLATMQIYNAYQDQEGAAAAAAAAAELSERTKQILHGETDTIKGQMALKSAQKEIIERHRSGIGTAFGGKARIGTGRGRRIFDEAFSRTARASDAAFNDAARSRDVDLGLAALSDHEARALQEFASGTDAQARTAQLNYHAALETAVENGMLSALAASKARRSFDNSAAGMRAEGQLLIAEQEAAQAIFDDSSLTFSEKLKTARFLNPELQDGAVKRLKAMETEANTAEKRAVEQMYDADIDGVIDGSIRSIDDVNPALPGTKRKQVIAYMESRNKGEALDWPSDPAHLDAIRDLVASQDQEAILARDFRAEWAQHKLSKADRDEYIGIQNAIRTGIKSKSAERIKRDVEYAKGAFGRMGIKDAQLKDSLGLAIRDGMASLTARLLEDHDRAPTDDERDAVIDRIVKQETLFYDGIDGGWFWFDEQLPAHQLPPERLEELIATPPPEIYDEFAAGIERASGGVKATPEEVSDAMRDFLRELGGRGI